MRHEVLIQLGADGKWRGVCRGCGDEAPASTHKRAVEAWRKQHYSEANR